MDYKRFFKAALPHLIAIGIFLSLSSIYFTPAFKGEILLQNDIIQHQMKKKKADDYREKTGMEPLWSNSLFSGMPTFLMSLRTPANLIKKVDKGFKLGLPHPARLIFILAIGFYFLLVVLNVNPWLGIVGGLAYAFTSYFMISIEAGHNTKIAALAYMPIVIAGITLLIKKKYVIGFIITALAMALQIRTNHYQITYYMLFILGVYAVFEITTFIKEKDFNHIIKTMGLIMLAFGLAAGTHLTKLWVTYEYGKESIRGGKSELRNKDKSDVGGLDRGYALRWSYGVAETMTLLIPNFYGGGSYGPVDKDSKSFEVLTQNGVPRNQAQQIVQQLPLYWGTQPFTSGPTYIGAIIIFLFVLSIFLLKGPLKWWLLIITILSILLAWGKNFSTLTDLFFYYVPYYNKFRAPAMILVIAEFSIPLMAIIGLSKIIEEKIQKEDLLRSLKKSAIIVGGICLLFAILPGLFVDFRGDYQENEQSTSIDQKYQDSWVKNTKNEQFAATMLSALREDRESILQKDAFRSIVFIALAGFLLWLFAQGKIKKVHLTIGIGLLILIDLWAIDKRYLNEENFTTKKEYANQFLPTKADQKILEDPDPHYRVLNLTTNTFNEASTSYFHKSIGGYHAAKLQRYQELIENQINPQRIKLAKQGFKATPVLNMLNTKYVIAAKSAEGVITNPLAMGNAWFVNTIHWVKNANEEMEALTEFDPAQTVVIHEKNKDYLQGFDFSGNNSSSIKLISYEPNQVEYEVSSAENVFAVFSEMYYNDGKGWNAYIDGKWAPHIRVNYVLRGLKINGGSQQIVFKFEPKAYFIGEKISLTASIALLLLVLLGLAYEMKQQFGTQKEISS